MRWAQEQISRKRKRSKNASFSHLNCKVSFSDRSHDPNDLVYFEHLKFGRASYHRIAVVSSVHRKDRFGEESSPFIAFEIASAFFERCSEGICSQWHDAFLIECFAKIIRESMENVAIERWCVIFVGFQHSDEFL